MADDDLKPYRAEPGQAFGYTDPETGGQREIKADGAGLVSARTPYEETILRSFDLPHARVAKKPTSDSADVAAVSVAPDEPRARFLEDR